MNKLKIDPDKIYRIVTIIKYLNKKGYVVKYHINHVPN
jgi:hypothetical protein